MLTVYILREDDRPEWEYCPESTVYIFGRLQMSVILWSTFASHDGNGQLFSQTLLWLVIHNLCM